MSVRARIVAAIFAAGALAALGVSLAVGLALQRFEHESAYARADAFLRRVIMQHPDLLALRARNPDSLQALLQNLLLYEPGSQLYLLSPDGQVLASSAELPRRAEGPTRVNMQAVREAAAEAPMPYVVGDDPARGGRAAIVAARPLYDTVIRPATMPDAYLYLVCVPRSMSDDRMAAMWSVLSQPALLVALLVVLLTTGLAAWMAAAVTRPLGRLSASVAQITRDGWQALAAHGGSPGPARGEQSAQGPPARLAGSERRDEFGQLARGFETLLRSLAEQWRTLRQADQYRREGVSNLSHDLRSPLTATAACLETLDSRWRDDPQRQADRELVHTALRNTRNAARLVQSLGDLAQLDEPGFALRAEPLDLAELLDDIAQRFGPRAQAAGLALGHGEPPDSAQGAATVPVPARVDVELIERALANLLDNAMRHTPAGGRITLSARTDGDQVRLQVCDTGSGIASADLPHLFDRFYQARHSTAPATGEGGKGLGLAIVKRIAELHGGSVAVTSTTAATAAGTGTDTGTDTPAGTGTCVTLQLPAQGPGATQGENA